MPLALPFDGVAPLLLHVVLHPFELWHTSSERKVLGESLERPCEVSLVIAPSPMAVLLQPRVGAVQALPTAFLGRNADDRTFSLGIAPADVLETQQRAGAGLAAIRGGALLGKPPTEHHPCLFRSESQSKLLHAAFECAVAMLGGALVLQRDDTIVHDARQRCLPLHVFLGSLLKPEVDDVVPLDICEAWRNRAALRSAGFRPGYDAVCHAPRLAPLANEPCDHGVRNAQDDHRAQPLMVAVRAIALDVCFVHLPHLAWHDMIAPGLQCHVRIASGAISTGALQTILFVNGTHHPCNCPLQQPILHRGDAEGPRCAVALGNLDAPHRRGVGLASSEPSPEILHAFLQVGLKLLPCLSI